MKPHNKSRVIGTIVAGPSVRPNKNIKNAVPKIDNTGNGADKNVNQCNGRCEKEMSILTVRISNTTFPTRDSPYFERPYRRGW